MYRILYFFLFIFSANLNAQNKDVISWINTNAIVIEDANPDTQLTAFAEKAPQNFKKARIFGFGEASHHGKEFFDIKSKYFKYLVEHQGVTLFLMEESYQAEKGINQWISGGEGDRSGILKNFGQGIWHCNEIADLLQWMRDYNYGKPQEKKIRFYGIDNQFGEDINIRVREYARKHHITIDESLLIAMDNCSSKLVTIGSVKGWADTNLPKLQQIRKLLEDNKANLIAVNAAEYIDIQRALWYLEQYTAYISFPDSEQRDRDMYDNVLQVLDIEGAESKAFIWAHNEHINKKSLGDYNVMSLGSRLKEYFKEDYYCVGFDFGTGVMKGYVIKNGQVLGSVFRTLDMPYKKTFAKTLYQARPDIYFIDMDKVMSDESAKKIFSDKKKQLFLGGPGFDPDNTTFFKRKYTEAYDGLIFVKAISPTT